MKRPAFLALLVLLMVSVGPHWAEGVVRTVAGLPSIAFAPPGAAQQIALAWESLARRFNSDRRR